MQALSAGSSGLIENWHASREVGTPPVTVIHDPIVVKGVTITRPNGSSEGRDALFRSMGANVTTSWAVQGGVDRSVPVGSGILGFARSSSQPPSAEVSASGDVTYIPFALDAVSWATAPGALSGVSLTVAQLNSLYEDCATVTVGATTLNPSQPGGNVDLFAPQSGSGTRSFWQTTVAPAGFGPCVFDRYNTTTGQPVTTGGSINQEHDGTVTSLNATAITPYSIAQWVAQANGTASSDRRHGAVLHQIAGVNATNGTGPFTTNPNFPVTRPVFNIVPTAQLNGLPKNNNTEFAFWDPTPGTTADAPPTCTNTSAITSLGFILLTANPTDPWNCGDAALRAYPNLLP
ncbi:hypothetical protein C1I92_24305 [Jiangella anatolica]|uniref:PBP domain-containing protein n=1 Tax=Jiangella anatolica TaxID=2670374 RepID=A0A2W2C4U8_9ACTN|nr:hypothetical protein C1I92_24305 [Jiangella anatolica]